MMQSSRADLCAYECSTCGQIETITAFVPEACSTCGATLYLSGKSEMARAAIIAAQNDRFRQTWGADFTLPGQIVTTASVAAKGGVFLQHVMVAVTQFSSFTPDNDPNGWHDFGVIEAQGQRLYWKIDLYDMALEYGSPDPLDPKLTRRVLTITRPEEH